MCGIVGIFNYRKKEKVDIRLLAEMRDIMCHRGPDDYGLWVSKDGFIGLGHRRLSIIDLSKKASQPMCNEDQSVWVISNGEIYNHLEIRKELEKRGHIFRTDHSDTEVIVHSFEEWGINCLEKFRGPFAIGLWDDNNKELWLIRDRIGIKPIYYAIKDGKFVFASEIKSILVDNKIARNVNETGLYHYLSFLTVPAPDTMFKDIKKLNPGCYLKIKYNGQVNIKRYWDVYDNTKMLINESEDNIAGYLLEELKTSIDYRGISDVPIGIFLSGGIDSSIIAALFSLNNKKEVNTFTIGYEGDNKTYQNEFDYARMVAEKIGANYYEKKLNVGGLIDFLNDLVFYQDEPIADPVCFPVYQVSKFAKDNGITVCQLGEGSDELFIGYPGWQIASRLYKLNKLPIGLLKKISLSLLKVIGKKDRYSYEWLRRGTRGEPIFWGGAEAFFEGEKKVLLSDRLREKFTNFSSLEAIKPILKRFNEKAWEKTPFNWMSYLDINLRLPELLLMRVDKMSMATSLEARVPFLDNKFVELAMSIPQDIKVKNNQLKYLLKKSVKGLIPDEIINREKQGFGVPIYEWFLKELGSFAKSKLIMFSKKTDFFNSEYLKKLLYKKEAKKIWYLLNFVLWHEKWIERK